MMGIISLNLDTETRFPTDGTKLMRPDLISRVPKMDPSPHFSTCRDNRIDPSNMDIGVVPARMSLMPKLEWRERY